MDARVSLIQRLQAIGGVRLDVTVSLLGEYSEDDERKRWRIVAMGVGRPRTYCGRSLEEAIEAALSDGQQPDPFPSVRP